ncbi:MAG: ABC transporter permease, partial [Clostridia bacterium]|nr:ABC transporter permease [Clostridia bacterium]
FTAPFIMPYKLLNSDVATSDILISIGLLLVSIAIVSMISIKIYSASVLHYGSKKLKIKDVLTK